MITSLLILLYITSFFQLYLLISNTFISTGYQCPLIVIMTRRIYTYTDQCYTFIKAGLRTTLYQRSCRTTLLTYLSRRKNYERNYD